VFFDPLYLVFMAPALLFSLWASWRTKSTFNKYQRVGTLRGVTGAQAAAQMLRSAGISDVQIVQAYLRHRPITDGVELRAVAMKVAQMDAVPAQVRAIETLARLRIGDAAILDELRALSLRTKSPAVRQAVDEVFLRSERR
jgi:Zn-dependent membrane protease YugP